MESQCEYFMYFPAAPISSLSDPADYATLPRRNHVYLGEVVQFLLVLRSRNTPGRRDDSSGILRWKELAGSLSALASACVAESCEQRPGSEYQPDLQSTTSSEEGAEEESGESGGETPESSRTFTQCSPHFIQNSSAGGGRQSGREPVKSSLVLEDQVIFSLTVSLDKLPVNTLKTKIVVTVWRQEEEVEVREHGYLTLLQLRSPMHTFRQDLSTFRAQVSTILNVLPPPSVQCQHMAVSGKHLTVLKVLNCSSQDELCVRDVKILPNYNSSYLPMMPDGSVLVVDNVCHQSAEVTVASFYRMDGESSRLPSTLSALEEHNFLFQLQLQDKAEEDSSEGLEVHLVAVLQWYSPTLPLTRYISSCYLLPSIRLDRPLLVLTASCPRAVRPLEHFWVKYTLLNNLQDFLTVRLIWNSDADRGGQQHHRAHPAVVCQSPLNNLGQCRKGSTLSFTVAFQILRTGLFELSQHMKLKLQFTASVSTPPVEHRSPMRNSPSSSSSSSSPAARELLDRHGLSRSQSFSHQQPSRSNHVRSSSVMVHRAATPPVGSRIGRGLPLPPPPDHALISLDKIAKRECKVLVLEPIQEAHGR